jgi:hypothetical protein
LENFFAGRPRRLSTAAANDDFSTVQSIGRAKKLKRKKLYILYHQTTLMFFILALNFAATEV